MPRKHIARLRSIATLFSNKFFGSVCKKYMGKDVVIDRIIINKSAISSHPITEWHADQQAEGRRSFKFMLYLSDVTENNGAFSYVRGSHTLVSNITNRAEVENISNLDIHNFGQIADITDRLGDSSQKKFISEIKKHIISDYESDDCYSISAKKGSILMFDTKGIHRGGCVRKGERILIRIHCFEPERGVVDDRSWMCRSVSDLKKWLFYQDCFGWGNS